MKKYILITIIGLVLLCLILVIILCSNKSHNLRNGNENNNSDNNFNYYKNNIISFYYPKSYGEVKTTIRDISTDKSVTSGKALGITFSENKNIFLILTSSDYKAFLFENYYDISKKFKDVCSISGVNNNGNGCRIRKFGSREVLEKTEYEGYEGVYSFTPTYSFLLNNKEYARFTLFYTFPKVYEELNPLQYGKEDITDQEREKIASDYAKSIIYNQTKGDMKKQIEEVENIISSLVEI